MRDSSGRNSGRLFVGTCTESTGSKGLYALSVFLDSGFVSVDHTVMSNPNPVFLAKWGHALVAAHGIAGKAKAAVYAAHDDGSIGHISSIADKSGADTRHVVLHPSGRWLYGSNYESGTLSCWPVRLDGSLGPLHAVAQHEGHGPNKCRQGSAHVASAHFIGAFDGAWQFVAGMPSAEELAASRMTPVLAAVDLGIDTVVLYEAPADEGLALQPIGAVRMPAGFGPRTIVVRPHAPATIAVVGELANAVVLYKLDDVDVWRELNCFDLPSCCGLRTQATHAQFSPCGKWLYVSVRGKNIIAVYEIDEDARVKNQAWFSCGGVGPEHFELSSCGRFIAVANKCSGDVVVFRTPKPGDEHMEELCRASIPSPTCVVWG